MIIVFELKNNVGVEVKKKIEDDFYNIKEELESYHYEYEFRVMYNYNNILFDDIDIFEDETINKLKEKLRELKNKHSEYIEKIRMFEFGNDEDGINYINRLLTNGWYSDIIKSGVKE